MTALLNYTPFAAADFALLDPRGRQYVVIVVKASFIAAPGQPLRLAEPQMPVLAADRHYGDPASSSVRYEADFALEKPAVDILVNGSAHAPDGRPAQTVRVGVMVGGWRKALVVHGDRFWRQGIGGAVPSAPQPFVTLPLVYERAFGGTQGQALDPRNPVGLGFRGARSRDPAVASEIANIEYPAAPITAPGDEPEPAGLGAIARSWSGRSRYAGTYDDAWLREQCPLLPLDFDPRHHQAAPPDQQVAALRGGEPVAVAGMTPQRLWRFTLPTLNVPLRLRYVDGVATAELCIDTLLLEPDAHRLTLTARAKVPFRQWYGPLEEIVLGHVKPGWWRARVRGKHYLDRSGSVARMRHARDFVP